MYSEDIYKQIAASVELQMRIRQQTIRIPSSYSGTIDPAYRQAVDGLVVSADSYGPFVPERYFDEKTYRIIFLLKESYIGCLSDGTGHDKADEYREMEWGDLERVYKNVARMAYSLVKNRDYVDSAENRDEALECMRNHVCIVNVNAFPAVASTHSNDDLIYQWAKCNESIIREQITLYRPDIVVGGHTIGHFVDSDGFSDGTGYIFGERFHFMYPKGIKQVFGSNWGDKNYVYYNEHLLYVNAYHPSYRDTGRLVRKIRNRWERAGRYGQWKEEL